MVRAGADFSGLIKGAKIGQQTMSSFQKNISGTMRNIKIALATVGIGALVKDSVGAAMQVEASVQQIGRIMDENSGQFIKWANTQALAYNMSKQEALKYGSVYGNLINGFSKSTEETLKTTQELLKASSIVASGTGRSMEDVMERIRSGLLGNTEAIEDLGIYAQVGMIKTTDAFKKFANGKTWDQLDYKTQQQIRLYSILEQASTRFGNSLANNTMSQQQRFIAQLKNIQLSLGQAFLPIYQFVLPMLTNLASKLSYVMGIIAQFSQALFGKAQSNPTGGTDKQAASVEKLGDAYDAVGKSAKGALAGFDEVNTLSSGSSAGADAGSQADSQQAGLDGTAKVDFSTNAPDIGPKVQAMSDKVKSIIGDLSTFMTTNKEIIVSSIIGIGAGFAAFQVISNWTAIITGLKTAIMGIGAVIGGISLPAIIIAAAIAALTAAFIYFYQTNETFRGVVDGILNSIRDAAVYLWQNVLVPFGLFLGTVFTAAWRGITAAAGWFWQNVMVPLGDFMLWFWNNVITPIATALSGVLGVAFQTVADIAKAFWENVLIPLAGFFSETFGPTVEAISAVFNFLWNKVLKPFGDFLIGKLKEDFTTVTNVIVYLLDKVLKPLATFVGGGLKETFTSVFKSIGDIIKGLKTALIGIMTFITGVFTGDWKKAWEGIKGIFGGIWKTFAAIVKAPINAIISMINYLIGAFNSLKISVPDWIPGVGGKSFGINIPSIPALAKGGITNGPTLAMIGDNPGGREVVSPLDDLQNIIASAVGSAMLNVLQFNQGQNKGDSTEVVIQVDSVKFARVILPALRKEALRTGNTVLQGV